jgi:proline iminopeptidase
MSTVPLNGTGLFYVSVGEGLPCLVMHGGLGVDHSYLHPWLDPLGDMLHLIYYDHRRNGRSGRAPKETMTHAQLAADADALRSHLGFDRVAILGHSYGGFIDLEYALRYPAQVSHLILMDTAPAFNYDAEIRENALRQGATEEMLAALGAAPATDDELRRKLQLIAPLYFQQFDAGLANRLFEKMVFSASGGAREGELSAYNVVPRLGEIRAPTLILVGRDDFICPLSQAHIMYQGIPDSELVVFEHSGHFPYLEESDAFFSAVRRFLSRYPTQ